MTRWLLAATAILGLGAFGTTALATDWNDVQREWGHYQRELRRGDFRDAQREYQEYCETLQEYNRERFGGYYAPAYGTGTYVPPAPATAPPAPAYGTTTYYYSQPYVVYPRRTYYYRPYIASGGGVVIWR